MNHLMRMTGALALCLATTATAAGDLVEKVYHAAAAKDPARLELLLTQGFDPEALHNDRSPLHMAAWHGRLPAARLLLAHGVDVDIAQTGEGDGTTPLMNAAEGDRAEMVRFLIGAGANPLARQIDPGHSDHGFMPLDDARKYNPDLLETEAGQRLAKLTSEGRGCDGVIVLAGDTKLSILAERVLGKASRWKEIAELNGLEGKGYRKGDCLALPKR